MRQRQVRKKERKREGIEKQRIHRARDRVQIYREKGDRKDRGSRELE